MEQKLLSALNGHQLRNHRFLHEEDLKVVSVLA